MIPPTTFRQEPLTSITTDDVEAYRDHRKSQRLSTVTVNHDLRLLRKMFNWGIRKGYLERTPFKIGTEPAIRLEREIPRNRRFEGDDDEQKLLAAANPHLRAVIVAMLDTACRPGEIFNLKVRDVSVTRRELTIRAATEKTRRERVLPISSDSWPCWSYDSWTRPVGPYPRMPMCLAIRLGGGRSPWGPLGTIRARRLG